MIKKIDNVTIDGANRGFGGYIYSLDYDANFAEQPSVLKVYFVNETGQYNITKEDLILSGAPVEVKIGTKITLFMYPISYSYEDSPDGKLLTVEYVDESVAFLDKFVVKLSSPTTVTGTQVFEIPTPALRNTIVLGTEDYTDLELNSTEETIIKIIYPNFDPRAVVFHAPITYRFEELMNAISSFVGTRPLLDRTAAAYKKDYSGKLREVLSGWCNDLGLGFYWENRKLNFIDLRNPASLQAVASLAKQIKESNKVLNFNESYSLRDTFTRGIAGLTLKNGNAQFSTGIGGGGQRNYYLDVIRLGDIPWDDSGSDPLSGRIASLYSNTDSDFKKKVKSAYYGESYFKAQELLGKDQLGGVDIVDINKPSEIIYKYIKRYLAPDPKMTRVTNGTGINPNDFNWVVYAYVGKNNIKDNFDYYQALASFYGSFFTFGTSSQTKAQNTFTAEVNWYHQRQLVSEISMITDVLGPLVGRIKNFSTLSLQQFLNNGIGPVGLTEQEILNAQQSGSGIGANGYIIKKIQPGWTPVKSDNSFQAIDFGNYAIIEGRNDSPDFLEPYNNGTATVTAPVFYFGIKKNITVKPTDPGQIFFPSNERILLEATRTEFASTEFPSVLPKSHEELYVPPENANVNYYELNNIELSEEVVSQFESFSAAVNNEAKGIPEQKEPFFSSQITIPNIDLAGSVNPKLGTGLQGFSINFSDNGIKSTYTIGTEKMRLRNPDIFYRYIYDPKKKKQDLVGITTFQLKRKRSYQDYYQ